MSHAEHNDYAADDASRRTEKADKLHALACDVANDIEAYINERINAIAEANDLSAAEEDALRDLINQYLE